MLSQDVCPSVSPSVTHQYSIKTAKHIFKVFLPSDSHTILVFSTSKFKLYGNIPTVPPNKVSNTKKCEKIAIFGKYHNLSRKWYKTEPQLPWKANRKPYPTFRMVPFSTILSDVQPRFQGHDIIWYQITRKWYKIERFLQCQTNRNSHAIHRIVQFPMTSINQSIRRGLEWPK